MNLTAQKRYREWAAQVDAQQSSGLTQWEWCRVHGMLVMVSMIMSLRGI